MSNVSWQEFKGWCKSFTKTEIFLCALQAIFLVVLIAFLTFLILHLVVCKKNTQKHEKPDSNLTEADIKSTQDVIITEFDAIHEQDNIFEVNKGTTQNFNATKHYIFTEYNFSDYNDRLTQPDVVSERTNSLELHTCTWVPSQKTKAITHYYENIPNSKTTLAAQPIQLFNQREQHQLERKLLTETQNGEELSDAHERFLLALVKVRATKDITFGCTLTVISEHWTLTAASCIEAVVNVHSLVTFVMMHNFISKNQDNVHPVASVIIHPQYEVINKTYDLAALKSEDNLVEKGNLFVTLPTAIDYFLIAIGERLTIVGYGRFRSADVDPFTRSIREVSVHNMPLSQCSDGSGSRSTMRVPVDRWATAPLCAGVLHYRTSPCHYCAGTPLLRHSLLLGIMSDIQHCGITCEPALFVNLVLVRDWLDSVLN